MMSLSDTTRKSTNDGESWQLLDINSLEHVGYEDSTGKDRRDRSDFAQFEKLYNDPGINDQDRFKLLYDPGKTLSEQGSPGGESGGQPGGQSGGQPGGQNEQFDQFVPMDTSGKPKDRSDNRSESAGPGHADKDRPDKSTLADGTDQPDEQSDEQSDETTRASSTPESIEHARKDGHANGLEQGINEGYAKGFEQGLAEGEKQGREEGEKKGYAAGAEKGEEEARAAGDKEARQLIESLETVLLKTEGSWEEHVKRYEGKMIALIGMIAEKVVMARVKVDRGVVRESIVHALGLLPEPEEVVLQVSDEDYEYIDMIKEDFFERIKTLTSISVVANSGISRGGCKIESRTARVETDVESRLKAVFDAVVAEGAP
jgi:flagellar assembly protein FliH